MHKRIEILWGNEELKVELVNSQTELYGTCLHKPDFHRYSTDDALAKKDVGSSISNLDCVCQNINSRVNCRGYFNGNVNNLLCQPTTDTNNAHIKPMDVEYIDI
jgi:hypothetical protein